MFELVLITIICLFSVLLNSENPKTETTATLTAELNIIKTENNTEMYKQYEVEQLQPQSYVRM